MSKATFWKPVGSFLKRQLGFDFGTEPVRTQRPARRRRPPAGAAATSPPQHAPGVARPPRGTLDLEFWRLLKARRDAGDPQQRRVYAWEREVLEEATSEPLLGAGTKRRVDRAAMRAAALAYLSHLWNSHAGDFRPHYAGIPYLRIGFTALRRRRGRRTIRVAHAVPHRHAIYCRAASLNRHTLVHEVCHLLVWGDGHGPQFCAALVLLWEREFGIERTHALRIASRMKVQVAPLPT